MSRALRCLLALLMWVLGNSGALAGGLLWEVRDGEQAVLGHLFGTVHLCDAACYPLPPEVRAAFAGSEQLALELDPADAGMGPKLAAAGMLPAGQRLEAMLPEAMRAPLARAIARSGVDAALVQSMRPWLAASVLMVGSASRAGFASSEGVDLWLARKARSDGRPLVLLETVERQIAALSGGGDQAQIEALAQILRLIANEEVGEFLVRIRTAWREGDDQALLDMLNEDADEQRLAPLLTELVTVRNQEMAARIAELLRSGRRSFVAVGAAHLAGAEGIVARLSEMGFEVSRVRD